MAEKKKAKKSSVGKTDKGKKKGGVKKTRPVTEVRKRPKRPVEAQSAEPQEIEALKPEIKVRKVQRVKREPVPEKKFEEEREYTPEEYQKMLSMYEQTFKVVKEGELVKGKILGITKDDVIVDVGFKSEGIIPLSEFPNPDQLKVEDEVDLFLEAIEDQNGQLVLSKQKADFIKVWDKIREAYEKGTLVEGRLLKRIKGE